MFLLMIAVLAQNPSDEREFRREAKRCGLVYNMEGLPAGDGVFIDSRHRTVLLSSSNKRPRKPIKCIGVWARSHGYRVRYRKF